MDPGSDSKPELRPGDAGFAGFQMQLPENCIEYMLFILDANSFSALEEVRKAALRLTDELTGSYIWQRDSFNLTLKREDGLTYLSGRTDYGDSVEDEWLIVYLLRELTKKFTNLWVRVADSDGEFLLVEAANVLPRWLSPENDAHRVWVRDGKLHLIPLASDAKKVLSLPDAVEVLGSAPGSLVHSPFVEAEAFYRLEKYPAQIADALHHATVTIPRKLAHILHLRPKSIAPATEAFYLRDGPSLNPLVAGTGQLTFPPDDLVTISIVFTKVLFAQLKSQRFDPPPVWKALIHSAQVAAVNGSPDTQKALDRLEMGMKITSGFEILSRKAEKSDSRLVRELALLITDLEEDGPSALPGDAEIKGWKDVEREDDEAWMDIDYESFERELDGKSTASAKGKSKGFGDKATEADLKKIVSRFEAFLNDESAGIDGAEMDEMDEDDDEDDEDDEEDDEEDEEDSEEEDKEVSFDEVQFAKMMREMMGFPSKPEETPRAKGEEPVKKASHGKSVAFDVDSAEEDGNGDEVEEIKKLMAQFESELNLHGALNLDPKPEKPAAIKDKGKGKEKETDSARLPTLDVNEEEESDDGEVDIDYNLAKNLLESFKGQAGLAGPAGNILSMLGIQLPRDEGDELDEDEEEDAKKGK